MARTNIEDDLESSGRLAKFARTMGWDHDKAAGRLMFVYKDTQRKGLAVCSREEFVEATAARADSDHEADAVFSAMVAARLVAILPDDTFEIKGSQTQIARLGTFNGGRSAGGQERARTGQRDGGGRFVPANVQHSPADEIAGASIPASPAAPSPSPSPSPSPKKKEGKEAHAPIETGERKADAFTAHVFNEHWKAAKIRIGVKSPAPLGNGDGKHVRTVMVGCREWQGLVDWYVGCGDKYAAEHGYPLSLLANQLDAWITQWQAPKSKNRDPKHSAEASAKLVNSVTFDDLPEAIPEDARVAVDAVKRKLGL